MDRSAVRSRLAFRAGVLAAAVAALLAAAPAAAGGPFPPRAAAPAASPGSATVAVVRSSGDVGATALVFRAAGGDCAQTVFEAVFSVAATGGAAIAAARPELTGLPAGVNVSFTPAQMVLAAGAQGIFQATLTTPAALGPGDYVGRLAVADAASGASDALDAKLTRCAGPITAAHIIRDPATNQIVLAPGEPGCSGTSFAARVEVESTGTVALVLRPAAGHLPVGAKVTFTPETLELSPGSRASFEMTVTVTATLPPSRYALALTVSDEAHGVLDGVVAAFTRCGSELGTAALRLVTEGELVLAPGAGGCYGNLFTGAVTVESIGTRSIAAALAHLEGLPAGVTASFSPATLALNPGASAQLTLSVLVPASLASGRYPATLVVEEAASAAHDRAAASFTRCDPPVQAGLRLIPEGGLTEVTFAAPEGACAGTVFRTSFSVESTGTAALHGVTPVLGNLPAGVAVGFSPGSVDLTPGGTASFIATLTTPASLAPGSYPLTLSAADAVAVASASVPGSFIRCAVSTHPRLRVVTSEVVLVPGLGGCSGGDFTATVRVVNEGDVALGAVMLAAILPDEAAIRFEPTAAMLAPGAEASFKAVLATSSALVAGSYRFALVASDAKTRAAASATLTLERCAPPVVLPDPPRHEEPSLLALVHRASKATARPGEVVTLVCTVKNLGRGTARGLEVFDLMPRGLLAVAGRSAIDGRVADDAAPGSPCRFKLPDLAPGGETTLSFQAVVAPGTPAGLLRSRAWARASGIESATAEATVEVTHNGRHFLGAVRGVVHSGGGSPVAGARLFLDSDRELRSGEDGRFEFESVTGGEHMVVLDRRSLSAESRIRGDDTRLVRLFEGQTEEVEFVLQDPPRLTLTLERAVRAAPGPQEATHEDPR